MTLIFRFIFSQFEVREAAQALLLAELKRIGPKGRKAIVDEWSPYLPNYADPYPSTMQSNAGQHASPQSQIEEQHSESATLSNGHKEENSSPDNDKSNVDQHHNEEEESEDDDEEDESMFSIEFVGSFFLREILKQPCCQIILGSVRKWSSAVEAKRKQSTAIVLLGVIGAEYGHETEQSRRKPAEDQKKKSVIEGFGPGNYSLARHTSKCVIFHLFLRALRR